jgi:hypothetical protein
MIQQYENENMYGIVKMMDMKLKHVQQVIHTVEIELRMEMKHVMEQIEHEHIDVAHHVLKIISQ